MNPLADDLNHAPVRETFKRYLIPAVAGMLIKCAFIFIDTLFIGRLVGADALGAVSLVIPYFSVFTAIAMMLGIGGATWMSIEFGKSNPGIGQAIFSQTLAFSLLVFSALVVVSWLTLDPVLEFMGAEGAIFTLSREYLVYLLPFLLSYSLNWVLSSFIRNDNHPKLAMVAMVVGALVNIVLDVIFIWWLDMGVGGAALATGIAQWVMSAILLSHFYSGKGRLLLRITRFGRRTIQRVGEMGAPSFFIEAALTITIVVFNFVLLNHYGEEYLIAYSLTVNLGVFALFLLLGVAQACQPIISYNFGAGHYLRVRQSFSLGLKYGICTGLAAAMLVAMFAAEIVQWFINDNQPLIALSSEAVRWYFISAPLMAANIIIATYFQALAKPKQSSALSLLRGLVFVLLGLFLLPKLFGDQAVWAAFVFAEGVTVGFSLYFIQRFPLESNGIDTGSGMSDARDPRPSDQIG